MPLDATMAPATFDPEARTVEAVIATTAPVQRRDARGAFSEVLDFSTLDLTNAAGLRVLDSHRTSSIRDTMGTVEAVRVDGFGLWKIVEDAVDGPIVTRSYELEYYGCPC